MLLHLNKNYIYIKKIKYSHTHALTNFFSNFSTFFACNTWDEINHRFFKLKQLRHSTKIHGFQTSRNEPTIQMAIHSSSDKLDRALESGTSRSWSVFWDSLRPKSWVRVQFERYIEIKPIVQPPHTKSIHQ